MPALHRTLCILLLIAALGVDQRRALAADRYVANLADGRRVTSSRLNTWPVPGSPIRWGDQDLLASQNPARLLRDREVRVELQPPFLLLANGDVLTGSPVELEADLGHEQAAPRVKVQLEGMLPVTGTGVAVRTDRVARIVGSAEASLRQPPPPGTVELADGRRFVARSIRWREYGLALLTAEGIIEANYPEIVDAVFPDVDRAAAVLDDNLWAGGTSAGTIARFQLAGGAVITTSRISREQERSRRRGRSGVELATYYYVQPAWAEQPLALPEREIAWCGYRPADQAPLALLPAELTASRRLVGSGPPWQARELPGGQLPASGEIESDVAISTHAHSELTFALPPSVRSLQTVVGLVRQVGAGGCVRCQIVAEKADGRVLWDSGILLGSDRPQPTGPIDVAGLAQVVLITQAAHDDRPPGADPLDIRDQVAWLAPLVQIELDQKERLPAVLSGLEHWQLAGSGLAAAQLTSEWNVRQQSWDPMLTLPKQAELVFTRKLRVTNTSDVVELRTACPDELDEHEFRLTVNGRSAAAVTNADVAELRKWLHRYGRQRLREEDEWAPMSDRLAYWWDLQAWRGQEVTLELTIGGQRERNEIAWRGFAVRGAVRNLPEGGRPLASDVPLTALEPAGLAGASERARPAKDLLPGSRADDRTIRFLGQRFTGGYGMMRDSSASFALRPEYRRFVAVVGCCNQVAGPLKVLIDDRVVWDRNLVNALNSAEQIDLAIPAGAKTLTLQVGKEGPYYGTAAWTNAGFVTTQ